VTSPTPTRDLPPELSRLRGSIDNIDAAVVFMLAERFKATKQVGVLKAALGMPASDLGREALQVARLRALAREADLDPVFAEKFLAFIVEEVIRHHEEIAAAPTALPDPGGAAGLGGQG
jgi:chorismate mutase